MRMMLGRGWARAGSASASTVLVTITKARRREGTMGIVCQRLRSRLALQEGATLVAPANRPPPVRTQSDREIDLLPLAHAMPPRIFVARPPFINGFDYRGPHAYSVTCCTHDRQRYFADVSVVATVVGELHRTSAEHQFELLVHCVM